MAKRVATRTREPVPPAPPPSPLRAAWVSVRDFVVRRRLSVGGAIIVLAGLIILYDKVTPTLEEAAPDPNGPFSFSFAVKTGWLPINIVRVTYTVRNLNMNGMTPNVRIGAPEQTLTDSQLLRLPDNSTRVFRYLIGPPGPFVQGTGIARIEYESLFLPRVLEGTFSYVGEVGLPRWVKGDLYRRGS